MSSRLRRLGCRGVAFLASVVVVAIMVLVALRDWKLGGWLVIENGIVENLQVVLIVATGVLAARQGWAEDAAASRSCSRSRSWRR